MIKTCSPGTSRFDENDSLALCGGVSKNFYKNTSQIICQQNILWMKKQQLHIYTILGQLTFHSTKNCYVNYAFKFLIPFLNNLLSTYSNSSENFSLNFSFYIDSHIVYLRPSHILYIGITIQTQKKLLRKTRLWSVDINSILSFQSV